MKRFLRSGIALSCALAFAMPAMATYATFFGEDVQGLSDTPLASVPNADAAKSAFGAKLIAGVATETFETRAVGPGPLDIAFGSITATLSGGSGGVEEVESGFTSLGRYSIPSASTKRLWTANATSTGSTFEVNFDQAVAAFGFYGIDIGDEGANVVIDLLDANGNVISALSGITSDMAYTKGVGGSTDGSVFFFGFVAGAGDALFNGVRFRSTTASTAPVIDGMGFDNFTVALRSEIKCDVNCGGGPNPAPEPGSIALVAAALLGLRSATRRKA